MHIAAGRDHSLAISTSGKVYASGNNAKGTLGLPNLDNAVWFSRIHTIESMKCKKVFAGVDHSFVLIDHVSPMIVESEEEREESSESSHVDNK